MNTQKLKDHVTQFRNFQDSSGRVVANIATATRELLTIRELLDAFSKQPGIGSVACILEDIDEWLGTGLDTPPDFINTASRFIDIDNLPRQLLYAGPMIMANAGNQRGFYFEFFYADIDVPTELKEIQHEFPHLQDKTVSIRFIDATEQLSLGNNVVFFPENISLSMNKKEQNFAVFMFDKFHRIYHETTLPLAKRTLELGNFWGDGESLSSELLDQEQVYAARCLWGYFHDYYHYQGSRPITTQLHVKMKWVTGLLEELKVDCQTALLLSQNADLPYRTEIFEFILFERLFRYPQEMDAEVNFDSGTGVFLFNWLWQRDVFIPGKRQWKVDFQKMIQSIEDFVNSVETLERLDDEAYVHEAHKMVFDYLDAPLGKQKFSINQEYHHFLHSVEGDMGLGASANQLQ